ncbi:hypothetical protein MUP77_24715 [Candidatus Bathyarchaeota archaeon]|nr:hypothetical protein [Candidatus Bathyarchaeota archaeon]
MNSSHESPSLIAPNNPNSNAFQVNWKEFSKYIEKTHAKSYSGSLMRYGKRYCHILQNPNKVSEIQVLPKAKQRPVMSALANLSKFLGEYDRWQTIVKNGGLKYQKYNALNAVMSILDTNLNDSKEWLLRVLPNVSRDIATILVFDVLTGLRPSEAAMSCALITELNEQNRLAEYYDEELGLLQHFKYKERFLRNSKNAYISFVSPELMKTVLENRPRRQYWSVQKAIEHAGFNLQVKMLRKLNATVLRNQLDREVIDLLQGRVGESIFVKFYYRPVLIQIREKTIMALEPLENELLLRLNTQISI